MTIIHFIIFCCASWSSLMLGIVGGAKAQQVAGTTMPGVRTRLTATKPASERPTGSRSGASKPSSGRPRSA